MERTADRAYEAIENLKEEAKQTDTPFKIYSELRNSFNRYSPISQVDPNFLIPAVELIDDAVGVLCSIDPTNIPKYASELHQGALSYPDNPKWAKYWLTRQIDFCRKFIGEDSSTSEKARREIKKLKE